MHPISFGAAFIVGVVASPRVRRALQSLQPKLERLTSRVTGRASELASQGGELVTKVTVSRGKKKSSKATRPAEVSANA